MRQEEKDYINYRFSGYQLPKIQLDSTGAQFYCVPVHPYFSKPQPQWQKPYYANRNSGDFNSQLNSTHVNTQKTGKIYSFLPIKK
jgi:hypothetical protein